MLFLRLPDECIHNILIYLSTRDLISLSTVNHRLYQLVSPHLSLSLSLPTDAALLASLLTLLQTTPAVSSRISRLTFTEPISSFISRPVFTRDLISQILTSCPNIVDLRLGINKAPSDQLKFYQQQRNIKFPWDLLVQRCSRMQMLTMHDYGDDALMEGEQLVNAGVGELRYLDIANCAFSNDTWRRLAFSQTMLRELYLFNSCREPYATIGSVMELHPYFLELIARAPLQVLHFRPEAPLSPESRNGLRDCLLELSDRLVTLVLENVGRLDSKFWKVLGQFQRLELLILTDGTFSGELEAPVMNQALLTNVTLRGLGIDANSWDFYDADWTRRLLDTSLLKWMRIERTCPRAWGKRVVKIMARYNMGWGVLSEDNAFEWRSEVDTDGGVIFDGSDEGFASLEDIDPEKAEFAY